MGWKRVKASKTMNGTDKMIKILTIVLGIFCMAIFIYGQRTFM